MAARPPLRCPRCANTLATAALNPERTWCSICAIEFDKGGHELPENVKPPEEERAQVEAPAPVLTVRDAAAQGAPASVAPAPLNPPSPGAPVQPKGRLLTVTAGDLSFSAAPPFTFRVGKTKVSVE